MVNYFSSVKVAKNEELHVVRTLLSSCFHDIQTSFSHFASFVPDGRTSFNFHQDCGAHEATRSTNADKEKWALAYNQCFWDGVGLLRSFTQKTYRRVPMFKDQILPLLDHLEK